MKGQINSIPKVAENPLTEVLGDLRMSGAFYSRARFSAPWGVELPRMDGHLMFHLVTAGRCQLLVEEEIVELEQGDFVFVPHGRGHVLCSDSLVTPLDLFDTDREQISEVFETLKVLGGGEESQMLCGAVSFDHPVSQRLIEALPLSITWKADAPESEGFRSTIALITNEARGDAVGAAALITRLADVLVIQALRSWLEKDERNSGWLAAIVDQQVGKALRKVHRDPEKAWTLEGLAVAAGMSRSAFAARFQELVGESPVSYLRKWRMKLAKSRIEHGPDPIGQIALDFGYESEAAFSRAFKRVIGKAPGSFRKSKLS